MHDLANELRLRSEHDSGSVNGGSADLDQAISLCRDAAALATDDIDLVGACLTTLCNCLVRHYERSNAVHSLDEAVSAGRRAVSLTEPSHAYRASRFAQAAHALRERFELSHNIDDLVEAVAYYRAAAESPLAEDEDPTVRLRNHALSTRTLFDVTGSDSDLDRAIEAIEMLTESQVTVGDCSQLARLLDSRFERSGRQEDLDAGIAALRRGLGREVSAPDRLSLTTDLAIALRKCFARSGNVQYLDLAEVEARAALEMAPAQEASDCLTNLGSVQLNRYMHEGDLAPLSEAVALYRRAAGMPRAGVDPGVLTNLSIALLERYEHARQPEDLEEAIGASRIGVDATSAGHPDRAAVASMLGRTLMTRFIRIGRLADIDEAVEIMNDAVASAALGSTLRRLCTANLGILHYHRYQRVHERHDLEEAVRLAREALAQSPDPSPERARHMQNLANALFEESVLHQRSQDLDEAIRLLEGAAGMYQDVERGILLLRIGEMYRARFSAGHAASDARSAVDSLRAASDAASASPFVRVTAARQWAELAVSFDEDVAVQGYVAAVGLLPRLSWRGASRRTRESLLSTVQGAACEAAACALATGRHELAVSLLEQGRSVLWTQQTELQVDLADLAVVDHELAERVARIRSRLSDDSDVTALDGSAVIEL